MNHSEDTPQLNTSSTSSQKTLRRHYNNPFFVDDTQQDQKTFHKMYQPYWLFFIVYLCELLSILLALLLLVVDLQNRPKVYLTYIVMTVVRVSVWIFNSIYLIGVSKSLFRLYFLLDNNLLFAVGTSVTYLAYNFGLSVQYKSGAMACYPILVFFLTGNYRVMLIYCKWDKWQFISYKVLKLFGAIFFLVYGAYTTKNTTLAQPDLFLLYIFTTFAYYSELYFGMNRLDDTDTFVPDYDVEETIDSQRLVNKKLIKQNSYLN